MCKIKMCGAFEFKCRRCGKIYKNPRGNKDMIWNDVTDIMHNGESQQHSSGIVYDKTTHSCKDGGMGIADLVGMSEVPL